MSAILFTNGDVTTQSAGQIVRQVGSAVFLALADTASNVAKLVGVRLSTVTAGNSGFIAGYVPSMKVRVEAEPTVGNELWLSSTNAGVAALAAGTVAVLLGVCVAKNQDGGIWYADVIPEGMLGGSGAGSYLNAKGDIPSHNGTSAQIVTIGASNGMVPTVDSLAPCGWSWKTPSSGGLQTIYDKDLSTLVSTANFADGANLIDGYTWTASNTANATQFKITNGSGLVMRPNTTSSSLAARTCPLITIPTTSFSASLKEQSTREIQSWFMFSNNQSVNSDSSVFGFETNPYDVSNHTRFCLSRGYYGGNGNVPEASENGVRTAFSVLGLDTAYDVIMCRWLTMTYGEMYVGASVAGAWPSLDSLNFRGFFKSPSSTAVAFAPNLTNRNIGLIVATYSSNTLGTFISTLKKLRIQAVF
jgi:hypothetical protein